MEPQHQRHHPLVRLPGPFVVLQGMHGDGLVNTLDTAPDFDRDNDDESDAPAAGATTPEPSPPAAAAAAIEEWHAECVQRAQHNVADWLQTAQQAAAMDQTKASEHIPILMSSGSSSTSQFGRPWLKDAKLRVFSSLPACDPVTRELQWPVVDDSNNNTARGAPQEQQQSSASSSAPALTLLPGTPLTGVSLHTFEAKRTMNQSSSTASSSSLSWTLVGECQRCNNDTGVPEGHLPKAGRLQLLQTVAPHKGYVVYSVDGYPLLAPGLASSPLFTGRVVEDDTLATNDSPENTTWWWKVVHAAGAVVRRHKELRSPIVATLPYGTHVQVRQKVLNQCGLPRLWIKAALPLSNDNANAAGVVEGWCSTALNPLSGQRGPIVQPVPLAAPLLAKVVYWEGAVVRSHTELSSPVVTTLPNQRRVSVTGRAFTEFPCGTSHNSQQPQQQQQQQQSDCLCVPRLRLSPSHYVSLCLANNTGGSSANHIRPPIVQILHDQVDATFDPKNPGLYHWKVYQTWKSPSAVALSTALPTATLHHSERQSMTTASSSTPSPGNKRRYSEPQHHPPRIDCVCCLSQEANATIIHGETGHICCCLSCARVCQAQGMGCPLCRHPIERIILHFYS